MAPFWFEAVAEQAILSLYEVIFIIETPKERNSSGFSESCHEEGPQSEDGKDSKYDKKRYFEGRVIMDEKFIAEYEIEEEEEKYGGSKTDVTVLFPLECAANHYYYMK